MKINLKYQLKIGLDGYDFDFKEYWDGIWIYDEVGVIAKVSEVRGINTYCDEFRKYPIEMRTEILEGIMYALLKCNNENQIKQESGKGYYQEDKDFEYYLEKNLKKYKFEYKVDGFLSLFSKKGTKVLEIDYMHNINWNNYYIFSRVEMEKIDKLIKKASVEYREGDHYE